MRDDDVGAVCAFLNRLNIGPNHWGIPYEAESYRESLAEYGIVQYLIATVGDEVVAVFHFSPTQQGESTPGIWAQLIVIDPQFRGTRVAEKLLRQAVTYLVNAGYSRVESTTSSEGTSLRLNKRGGFRQVSGAPLDTVEETLHHVNYVPLLARYAFQAFGAERDKLGLNAGIIPVVGGNPLNLASLPPVAKGSMASDRVAWHGGWVIPYTLALPKGSGSLECLVDMASDAVTSVTGDDVELACWPAGDERSGVVGRDVEVLCSLANRRDTPLRVELVASDSQPVVFDGVLDPGQAWTGSALFSSPAQGRVTFGFDASVSGVDGVGPRRFSVTTGVVMRGASGDAAGTSVVRAETDEAGWRLTSRTLTAHLSSSTGVLVVTHAASGQPLLQEVWPDVGPPYPSSHRRPLERSLHLVELGVRHGVPEVVVEAAANAWVGRDPNLVLAHPAARALDGLVLRRRLRLVDSALVEVSTTVRRERGSGAGAGADAFQLRIWPWALVPSPAIVVPLEAGLLVSPVVDFGFPFGLANLEHIHGVDLPSEPADVAAGWSAFEGGEWVAGLAWQDAAGLRYGDRWMPSVLFDVAGDLELGDEVTLPSYRLVAGRGDHRLVADAALAVNADKGAVLPPRLPGRLPVVLDAVPPLADGDGKARLRGTVRVVAGRGRPGRVEVGGGDISGGDIEDVVRPETPLGIDMDVAVPGTVGVHDVEVVWTEAEGVTRWRVPVIVPGEHGATIAVDPADGTVRGLPLGAIGRLHLVDPSREWAIHPPPIDIPWHVSTRPWSGPDQWQGVDLLGAAGERWPGLSVRARLATVPGVPVLLVSATFTPSSSPDPIEGAFSVVVPRQPGSSVVMGEVEISTDESFAQAGTDAPRIAHGRDRATVRPGPLTLAAPETHIWAARGRAGWQLTAHRLLGAEPTHLAAHVVWGDASAEAVARLARWEWPGENGPS
jgi:GNAT superfamily N-acetyltransferase